MTMITQLFLSHFDDAAAELIWLSCVCLASTDSDAAMRVGADWRQVQLPIAAASMNFSHRCFEAGLCLPKAISICETRNILTRDLESPSLTFKLTGVTVSNPILSVTVGCLVSAVGRQASLRLAYFPGYRVPAIPSAKVCHAMANSLMSSWIVLMVGEFIHPSDVASFYQSECI
jgi:hypothetical protein